MLAYFNRLGKIAVISGVLAVQILASTPAHAQSNSSQCVQTQLTWLTTPDPYKNRLLHLQLVMLTNNNSWASYAVGDLSPGNGNSGSGSVTQYFSDRTYQNGVFQNGVPNLSPPLPFSATATDQQIITLLPDGSIEFQNLTWGGSQIFRPNIDYNCYGNIAVIQVPNNWVILVNFSQIQNLIPPIPR